MKQSTEIQSHLENKFAFLENNSQYANKAVNTIILYSYTAIIIAPWLLIYCYLIHNKKSSDGDVGVPAKTGALTYLNCYSNANSDGALSVTVSPDGKHVYVSDRTADAVAWLRRD